MRSPALVARTIYSARRGYARRAEERFDGWLSTAHDVADELRAELEATPESATTHRREVEHAISVLEALDLPAPTGSLGPNGQESV